MKFSSLPWFLTTWQSLVMRSLSLFTLVFKNRGADADEIKTSVPYHSQTRMHHIEKQDGAQLSRKFSIAWFWLHSIGEDKSKPALITMDFMMKMISHVVVWLTMLLGLSRAWLSKDISSLLYRPSSTLSSHSRSRHICNVYGQFTDVKIPIIDLEESEISGTTIIPLPSAHLPTEMTTLNVYGMKLTRPVHRLIVEDALSQGAMGETEVNKMERVFGQIVYKPDPESLVGAIGCASEVIMMSPPDAEETESSGDQESVDQTILVRGSYRFVVKEVVKTIPFSVVLVDELCDDDSATSVLQESQLPIEDDDDEGDSPSQYARRCMAAMRVYLDQQLESTERDISPLEQSILLDSPGALGISAQREAVEEATAVFEVFEQYVIDVCPTPTEMYYAIAFLAAEVANLGNDVRRKILTSTNGVDRLKYVTQALEDTVGMARARKMAESITDEVDEGSKDLKVGRPELPPWSKSICKVSSKSVGSVPFSHIFFRELESSISGMNMKVGAKGRLLRIP